MEEISLDNVVDSITLIKAKSSRTGGEYQMLRLSLVNGIQVRLMLQGNDGAILELSETQATEK